MKQSLIFILLFFSTLATTISASNTFYLKNASEKFDVKIEVAECGDGFCKGKAKFSFYRKNAIKPFQIINLSDTQLWLDRGGNAQANVTLRYDEQSAVNFDDFNFDGLEDIAVCDGNNGGYGMPSYRVYLYSKRRQKFVYSSSFTQIGQGPSLGMFEVDKKKRMLYRFSKSGCCWHQTEGFAVINNRPKKVFEETIDATIPDVKKVQITTKRLIKGKWRTRIKYEKREEQ
jgi:hypothetical protein